MDFNKQLTGKDRILFYSQGHPCGKLCPSLFSVDNIEAELWEWNGGNGGKCTVINCPCIHDIFDWCQEAKGGPYPFTSCSDSQLISVAMPNARLSYDVTPLLPAYCFYENQALNQYRAVTGGNPLSTLCIYFAKFNCCPNGYNCSALHMQNVNIQSFYSRQCPFHTGNVPLSSMCGICINIEKLKFPVLYSTPWGDRALLKSNETLIRTSELGYKNQPSFERIQTIYRQAYLAFSNLENMTRSGVINEFDFNQHYLPMYNNFLTLCEFFSNKGMASIVEYLQSVFVSHSCNIKNRYIERVFFSKFIDLSYFIKSDYTLIMRIKEKNRRYRHDRYKYHQPTYKSSAFKPVPRAAYMPYQSAYTSSAYKPMPSAAYMPRDYSRVVPHDHLTTQLPTISTFTYQTTINQTTNIVENINHVNNVVENVNREFEEPIDNQEKVVENDVAHDGADEKEVIAFAEMFEIVRRELPVPKTTEIAQPRRSARRKADVVGKRIRQALRNSIATPNDAKKV